jgi:hypothetical protein
MHSRTSHLRQHLVGHGSPTRALLFPRQASMPHPPLTTPHREGSLAFQYRSCLRHGGYPWRGACWPGHPCAAQSNGTAEDYGDYGYLTGSFSGAQSLAEQVPELLGCRCLSRENDTVTALRQYQCHISSLIMRDRFNASRVGVGKEAVAVRADIGGEQFLLHTPDRNPGEACDGHVTYRLRDVMPRASGPRTPTWRLGVYDSAAVEVFTGCVPVRGSCGQPQLALQRSRAYTLPLSTVAGHQEEFARV